MPESGGQPGNSNKTKGMECRQALKRVLARRSGKTYKEGLEKVMEKYVDAAENGEPWALKDIIDRLDGKPAQALTLSGPDGGPVQTVLNYNPVCNSNKK